MGLLLYVIQIQAQLSKSPDRELIFLALCPHTCCKKSLLEDSAAGKLDVCHSNLSNVDLSYLCIFSCELHCGNVNVLRGRLCINTAHRWL